MKKKTLGMMIASLRKENGMTQLDLAEKMGVTDKAVSKWERDLSCPDVNTIPKLAEVFGISAGRWQEEYYTIGAFDNEGSCSCYGRCGRSPFYYGGTGG